MKTLLFCLSVFLILIGCNDTSIFDKVAGKWNTQSGAETCSTDFHDITFSDDFKSVTLDFNNIVSFQGKRRKTYVYNVLDNGKKYITLQLNDESRETKDGDLIAWQLALINENSYAWHRLDWPQKKFTPSISRCDG